MPEKTLQTLFELAINWENQARHLYDIFPDLFRHEPKVSVFWMQYSQDESEHIDVLKEILQRMPREERLKKASNEQWKSVVRVEGLIREATARKIQTLDDAYEMAHQLEMSEVNTVFKLLAIACLPEEEGHEFVSAHIKEHIQRLMNFGKEYTKSQRKRINVQAT